MSQDRMEGARACSVSECSRVHKGHGYCQMHLKRLKRGVELDAPIRDLTRPEFCIVPGCHDKCYARKMCVKHYARAANGQPVNRPQSGYGVRPRALAQSSSCHKRISKLWGPARNYPCVSCQLPAKEWAYDGTDPEEMYLPVTGDVNASWNKCSQWPEFYKPLCLSCHRSEDKAALRVEMYEYREWKHRTKRTVNDLPPEFQQEWNVDPQKFLQAP